MSSCCHGMVCFQIQACLKTLFNQNFHSSMGGGELFQRIQDRADGAFTERGMLLFAFLHKISEFFFNGFPNRSCRSYARHLLSSSPSSLYGNSS